MVIFHEFELRGARFLLNPKLESPAGFENAVVAQGAEESLQKSLRLAVLVAVQRPGEPREITQRGL